MAYSPAFSWPAYRREPHAELEQQRVLSTTPASCKRLRDAAHVRLPRLDQDDCLARLSAPPGPAPAKSALSHSTAPATMTARATSMSNELLHGATAMRRLACRGQDQRGIGAAEAEAVGHGDIDLALLGAMSGTRSIAVFDVRIVEIDGGRHDPSRMASRQKIASTAPAAPSRWPIDDLVDDMAVLRRRIAQKPLHRAELRCRRPWSRCRGR